MYCFKEKSKKMGSFLLILFWQLTSDKHKPLPIFLAEVKANNILNIIGMNLQLHKKNYY